MFTWHDLYLKNCVIILVIHIQRAFFYFFLFLFFTLKHKVLLISVFHYNVMFLTYLFSELSVFT